MTPTQRSVRRLALSFLLLATVLAVTAAAASPAPNAAGEVLAYPSARTVGGNGLPDGGARAIHLATGRGEREGAWIVAKGGGPIQAKVIRALHAAAISGDPWCSGKALLAAAGAKSRKMGDVFKSKPDRCDLIESNGRGQYRLALR